MFIEMKKENSMFTMADNRVVSAVACFSFFDLYFCLDQD